MLVGRTVGAAVGGASVGRVVAVGGTGVIVGRMKYVAVGVGSIVGVGGGWSAVLLRAIGSGGATRAATCRGRDGVADTLGVGVAVAPAARI